MLFNIEGRTVQMVLPFDFCPLEYLIENQFSQAFILCSSN